MVDYVFVRMGLKRLETTTLAEMADFRGSRLPKMGNHRARSSHDFLFLWCYFLPAANERSERRRLKMRVSGGSIIRWGAADDAEIRLGH
jgi:hypothetical protein